MSTVRNATRGPLAVPLPGGRKLHLGPGQTGEISAHAAKHPPLMSLVAAGQLEVFETEARHSGAAPATGALHGPAAGFRPGTKPSRRGDR